MENLLESMTSSRANERDQLNNRIFFRLFQLGNLLQRQSVSELGVTTVQWAVLGALSQERYRDGMQFRSLADYLVVSRQNLDGVLKRLERDGYVERFAPIEDRRARLVRLTAEGREFWADLSERIFQFYDQAASHFRFDERVALVHYLNALQKDLVQVKLPNASRPVRLSSDGDAD